MVGIPLLRLMGWEEKEGKVTLIAEIKAPRMFGNRQHTPSEQSDQEMLTINNEKICR